MLERVKADPNTNTYATLDLKNKNIDLSIFFLERGGSFSLVSKHLRNSKQVGMVAVKINSNNFQYLGKNIKDDDEIFKLAFQQDKELLGYAIERLRKTKFFKIQVKFFFYFFNLSVKHLSRVFKQQFFTLCYNFRFNM